MSMHHAYEPRQRLDNKWQTDVAAYTVTSGVGMKLAADDTVMTAPRELQYITQQSFTT